MSQKEPLSRPVMITGVVVPVSLGVLAIVGPLLTAHLQNPPEVPTTGTPASLATSSAPEQTEITSASAGTDVATGEEGRDVTVSAGNTATVLSGKVFIALLKTEEDGNPPRNMVYATLSSDDAGVKDGRIKGRDAGFSTIFNGFKIRVMSVETNSARFRVTRLPVEPTPTPEPTSGSRH